jgi:uncharacterized protein (DUF488 family)
MSLKLWTVSYDGRSASEMVDKLKENGIERVIHIGSVAQDLEGSALEGSLKKGLEEAGIEFEHVSGVGEPPQFRGTANIEGKDDLNTTFNNYLSRRSFEMDQLRKKVEERPTAILCFLQGERACEGAVLVQLLQREGSQIKNL